MEKYNFSEQINPLLEILSICSNIKNKFCICLCLPNIFSLIRVIKKNYKFKENSHQLDISVRSKGKT